MKDAKQYTIIHKPQVAGWTDANDYLYLAHLFLLRKCDSALRDSFSLDGGAYRSLRSSVLGWFVDHHYMSEEDRINYR